MPAKENHIVSQIRFELQAADRERATLASDVFSTLHLEDIVGDFLQSFDEMEETIRIDRVEIDAGLLEPEQLETLEKILAERVKEALVSEIKKHKPIGHRRPGKSNAVVIPEEDTQRDWQILWYYFSTGNKIWYATEGIDLRQLWNDWIAEYGKDLLKNIPRSPQWTPVAFFRMAQLFSAEQVTSYLLPAIPLAIRNFLLKLQKLFPQNAPDLLPLKGVQIPVEMSIVLLKGILQNEEASRFMIRILQSWISSTGSPQKEALIKRLIKIVDEVREMERLADPTLSVALQKWVLRNKENSKLPQANRRIKPNRPFGGKENEEDISDMDMEGEGLAGGNSSNDIWEEESKEDGLVTHAGLVLLNPGLMMLYFVKMGWVADKKIVNDLAAHSIRLWMHYLVWGEQPPLDFNLALAKIFTGMPLQKPASFLPRLTAEQCQQGDQFLKEVIGYWEQLKKTSPDGLRSGFLQRNGLLSDTPNGWQLQIEQKPQDILINHLPWTYSIIKFPWMTKLLFTQWNTSN